VDTGCGGDKRFVWTSDECGSGRKEKRLAINVGSGRTKCSKLSSRRQVRCCAEIGEKTFPDPVTFNLRGSRA